MQHCNVPPAPRGHATNHPAMAVGPQPDQVSEDHGAADGDGVVAERNGSVGVVGAVDGDDDKVVEQVLVRKQTSKQTSKETNERTNHRI